MKPQIAYATNGEVSTAAGRGFDIGALWALFVLTLRRAVHGRRIVVLSLLFLLPAVLALVFRLTLNATPQELEFGLVFLLIPNAIAPLTALLYAGGMVQDEVEEQTLTYLLLRPLPRWALYITKFAATWLVTSALASVFTSLAIVVLWWSTGDAGVILERVGKTALLLALAQLAYCAFFSVLSLLTRRSLLAGLCYIVGIDGFLASFDWVVRQLTVVYYFRVLAARWLDLEEARRAWALQLDTAPSATKCVLTLAVASVVLVVAGAVLMMRTEFRMKTPEGS
jgi:ABC-2 type transport system permease protein